MRFNEIIKNNLKEAPSDLSFVEIQKLYLELIDLYQAVERRDIADDEMNRVVTIVKTIGRKYSPNRRSYTAGQLLDFIKQDYRKQQFKSGQKPKLDLSGNTQDIATQIALYTNGYYRYHRPIKWTSEKTGKQYSDPSTFIEYDDEQSYDDGWEYIKSLGKEINYRDSMNHLRNAIQVGKFIFEPASVIRGAFSNAPSSVHRISVMTTKALQNPLRQVQDITPQQASTLHDIANTKFQNSMEQLRAIMDIFQGQQNIKQIIDNSKKVTPQDKAKLDAIIAGAKNFKDVG